MIRALAELLGPPVGDVTAAAARCAERVLEREGIAMFVGLADARPGRGLVVRDRLALAEGARLAALLRHYGQAVGEPVALLVLGEEHLRARA